MTDADIVAIFENMDSHIAATSNASAAGTFWFGVYQFTRPASPVGLEVLR
ncbi:MAG: hypothetical protein ACR2J8_07515 [Thermomicrobiales bacterium]